MTHHSRFLERARSAADPSEQKSIYDKWSSAYDADLDELGYVGPLSAAHQLARYLPETRSLILDAGCGTGKVGAELKRMGYSAIHGADISQGMMDLAQQHDCYRKLFLLDLTKRFDHLPEKYDAVISVGILGRLIPTTVLSELIQITKPGGILCLTIRDNYTDGRNYKAAIDLLEEQGIIELLAADVFDYIIGENHAAPICILQKNDV
ncbi:MAG: class I SAM-dependent methyltransferase [Chloroflexota bacterium]